MPDLLLFARRYTCLLFLLTLPLSGLQAEWYKQTENIMGTLVNVELWHGDPLQARACAQQVFSEMHRIDALMSPYKADSEISTVNREAALNPVRISHELYDLLLRAQTFSTLSDGAFDITFASIGQHYDYRAQKSPGSDKIAQQLINIDYHHVNLKDSSVTFSRPGVRIDLGGIAKGYAVDRAIRIVKQCQIKSALVSAGGDSRILGDKNGRPWMMGIQHPRKEQQVALMLPLSNSAISTSGDYERFFLRNGERIHHIINPSTGRSAKNSWSASVIGPDATSTDALSTTLFILGAEEGIKLIDSLPDIDAVIIDSNGVIHYSSGLLDPQDLTD
jgi:thiamine biosynthesis lipoprotein